jgi:hypothetical protein
MVLEERFPVGSENTAKDVVQYLKKEGVSARVVSEPSPSIALILSGKYSDLKQYLKEHKDSINVSDKICEEYQHTSSEDTESERWEELLSTLDSDYEQIKQIMDENNPGDFIAERIHRQIFHHEDSKYPTEEYLQELSRVRILISNHFCEITEKGFVLTKKCDPEEVVFYLPFDISFPPSEEICETYHIICIRNIKADMQYSVLTGPDILFLDDIESFISYLSGQDVSLYEITDLAERILTKINITQEVIDWLIELGDATIDEIKIYFIEEVIARDGEGFIQTRFNISPVFIEGLIADLRKLNIIKGKDSRLRLVNPAEKNKGKSR